MSVISDRISGIRCDALDFPDGHNNRLDVIRLCTGLMYVEPEQFDNFKLT
jgi:hypothetical protein